MQRSVALLLAALCLATAARAQEFQPSFSPGAYDPAGQFMGGTEMRLLEAHGGKLFAGNGYWEDRPGPEGVQGAQILVLDRAGGGWRVDHAFRDPLANGRWRDLAVGALLDARFATDGAGRRLPQPVSILIASTWDLTGATRVFARDDATGSWTATTLAQDQPAPGSLPQIRSFATHRDRVTGVDLVFAGEMPRGIFAGGYDPAVPGRISWSTTAELDASRVSSDFAGLRGHLRVSSFAEANGLLYAAAGQQVFERTDGPAPTWRLIYTNPDPGHSETGLRGLTAVPGAGGREMLLAAVEGDAARMVRIDPATGAEATELDLPRFLSAAWGMRVGYTIAAYNDMTAVPLAGGGRALLIGVMAFVRPASPVGPGHQILDVGYGRVERGAWYLVRWPDGHYGLHPVVMASPAPLVAVRTIRLSPFPGDGGTVFMAGFDANKAKTHDTAWIARADLATVLGRPAQ
jgi:hypothetical protein